MVGGGEAPGGLAVDRDEAGVSPEAVDVFLDPGEGGQLVSDPSIAGNILSAEREEAQRAQPVPDLHQEDLVREVEQRPVPLTDARPSGVASAVEPDQHRQPPAGLNLGDKDVQVETVLVTGLSQATVHQAWVGHQIITLLLLPTS